MEYDYKGSCLKQIELSDNVQVERSGHKPNSGDIIAVRIDDMKGEECRMEVPGGDFVPLETGDVVLATFGDRAGLKEYIGRVPERVEVGDKLSLIGGPDPAAPVFGEFVSGTKDAPDPVEAEFLGYVVEGGDILNMREFGIERRESIDVDAEVMAVLATRMDSGKTTLASRIIEELVERGHRVGCIKATGLAMQRDRLKMEDSGAQVALDFVDAGLPSTVEGGEDVVNAARGLIHEAWTENDLDLLVMEFGAGIISKYHVQDVIRSLDVRESLFSIAGVALDVTGAYGLKRVLDEADYEMDFVSGPITDTSAGVEDVEEVTGVPALNAFREEDIEEAVDIIEERLDSSL